MNKFLSGRRRFFTLLLALIGIAVTLAYVFCLGSCSYLKGDIMGIDLKYLGIFYMAVICILAWLRKFLLCLLLLAFGAGGEIFLIGYQVHSGVYCPYCMAFAATIFLALAVNFESNRKTLTTLTAAAGLLFFSLFFSGATPTFAAEPDMPAFGKGSIEVRLYTGYFCKPCATEEPEVISIISDLVDRNHIRVVFIDMPGTPEAILYTRYFLAALNARRDFRQAVATRAALFEAAGREIGEKDALEAFLKARQIEFLLYDTAQIFKIFDRCLKEDGIYSTPTCVIIDPKGRHTLKGKAQVMEGLRELQKLAKP
jgi:hypothetical protein